MMDLNKLTVVGFSLSFLLEANIETGFVPANGAVVGANLRAVFSFFFLCESFLLSDFSSY
jgi:hypothetical protein